MKNLHILFLPTWYSTPWHPLGGIFIQKQVLAHKKKGYKTGVIFINWSPSIWGKVPFSEQYKITLTEENGIPTYRSYGFFLPKNNIICLKIWLRVYDKCFKAYYEKYGKPNIIHAHVFWAGYAARYLSKKYNIPYVLTEHYTGFILDDMPKYVRNIAIKALDGAQQNIAVSAHFAQILSKEWTKKNVNTISNIVNDSIFTLKTTSLKEDKVNFISVGSLVFEKNYELLIKSFITADVKNAQLTIIGSGQKESKLRQLIDNSLYNEKIILVTQPLSSEELNVWFHKSDVFISSSIVETQGIAIMEAMCCGLPVIVTNSGGIADKIEPHLGTRLVDSTISSMAEAIKKMSVTFDEYQPQRQRDFIIEIASEEIVMKKLHEIYLKTIKS